MFKIFMPSIKILLNSCQFNDLHYHSEDNSEMH